VVRFIDELKNTHIANTDALVGNKILRGLVKGGGNAGYDVLNFLAEASLGPAYNAAKNMQAISKIPQAIKAAPQAIKNEYEQFKANPVEKTAEAVGYGVGSLALGGLGAKKVPVAKPTIPKTQPKVNVKPKIPEIKNGVTTDMLAQKNLEYRKNLSPAELQANIESNYIGGDPKQIANEYLANTRRNITNLAFVDAAGNVHNPYGAYDVSNKQILLSPQATTGTEVHEGAHALLYRMMDAANNGNPRAIRFLDEVYNMSGRGAKGNEAFAYGAEWARDPNYAVDLNQLYKYGFNPEDVMDTGALTERLYGYRR
jgi:hypothetical protein